MYTENIGRDRNRADRSASYRGYNQMRESVRTQPRTANDSCEYKKDTDKKEDKSKNCFPSLAMAYIECQKWENIYEADAGFSRGTIFCDLDKPWKVSAFAAGACKRNGGCR